jgi:hypothetical protein
MGPTREWQCFYYSNVSKYYHLALDKRGEGSLPFDAEGQAGWFLPEDAPRAAACKNFIRLRFDCEGHNQIIAARAECLSRGRDCGFIIVMHEYGFR